jgi:hypothetical protein
MDADGAGDSGVVVGVERTRAAVGAAVLVVDVAGEEVKEEGGNE